MKIYDDNDEDEEEVDDATFEFFMETAPTLPDGGPSAQLAKDMRRPTQQELGEIRMRRLREEVL